jgi:hypothetical protein
VLPLEGNDRLSSSSKGRVRENFLINQQMSTFAHEIRIESVEAARVPSGPARILIPISSHVRAGPDIRAQKPDIRNPGHDLKFVLKTVK